MKQVKFTYQRTKEDLLKQTIWQRMVHSKFNLGMNILFPFFGITALLGTLQFGEITPIQTAAVIYLIFFPVINLLMTRFSVNRKLANPNVVFDDTTYTIDEAGINIQSVKGEYLLKWEDVYSIHSKREYFYIFFDRGNALQINKAFIGDVNTKLLFEIFEQYAVSSILRLKK